MDYEAPLKVKEVEQRHHEDYQVFNPNLAHDPDRVAHYAERGIREIYFHGNTGT
jgi:hypothetical protein